MGFVFGNFEICRVQILKYVEMNRKKAKKKCTRLVQCQYIGVVEKKSLLQCGGQNGLKMLTKC